MHVVLCCVLDDLESTDPTASYSDPYTLSAKTIQCLDKQVNVRMQHCWHFHTQALFSSFKKKLHDIPTNI